MTDTQIEVAVEDFLYSLEGMRPGELASVELTRSTIACIRRHGTGNGTGGYPAPRDSERSRQIVLHDICRGLEGNRVYQTGPILWC